MADGNKEDCLIAREALYETLCFIKEDLDLSNADLAPILKVTESRIECLLAGKEVPLCKCILYLIEIHRNLCSMFSERKNRAQWLNTEHPVLRRKPIDVLKQELQGLDFVKSYLDYVMDRGA